MNNKSKIIILYYEEKLNIVEIANKLNISKQYVSKIVRKDYRHSLEKKCRKEQTAIKRKEQLRLNKKTYMEKKKADNSYEQLIWQHNQATSELSRGKTINNRAFKKWNSSIYGYFDKAREYRVKDEFKDKVSYAIPKKIKWY